MDSQDSITQWISRVKGGDQVAAQQLWDRYFLRLLGLARTKLRSAPGRVADEEDVVLDAMASFFRGAEENRFGQLETRDDLWQLLVMLTARKAANQLKWQNRQKRGAGKVRGESVFANVDYASDSAGISKVMGDQPTPEFALEVAEQGQRLLDALPDDNLRQIALRKMEGFTNKEIAARQGCKERTIERKLKLIRKTWSQNG